MDNNNSSNNGLDLNPDMMTTQSSVPTTATPPAANIPPEPAGIIDITPGAPEIKISPPVQHVDTASLPEPTISHIVPIEPVTSSAPPITPPAQPTAQTMASPTLPTTPAALPTELPPLAVATPENSVVTPPPSPLAENPDLVGLAK